MHNINAWSIQTTTTKKATAIMSFATNSLQIVLFFEISISTIKPKLLWCIVKINKPANKQINKHKLSKQRWLWCHTANIREVDELLYRRRKTYENWSISPFTPFYALH